MRRPNVLSLPLQLMFPAGGNLKAPLATYPKSKTKVNFFFINIEILSNNKKL
jgi:hypothetical protein